jgi:sulfite exporter TauE/SafE
MTTSADGASRSGRLAAEVLWRALVLVAGLHTYWVLGGTWGVHAASGGAYSEPTTTLRIQSAVIAVLLIAACVVVRARAGLSRLPLPDRFVRIAMWALAATLVLAAVANLAAATNWERYAIGPLVLLLALLAFLVAGSGRDWRRAHPPHPTVSPH